MFDLVRNNKKLVQILLALITLPFAFWGIDSYQRFFTAANDVANVDGQKISEQELGEQGRIVVRYSGTEPLLRIMIEGENEERITRMADTMAETAQRALG